MRFFRTRFVIFQPPYDRTFGGGYHGAELTHVLDIARYLIKGGVPLVHATSTQSSSRIQGEISVLFKRSGLLAIYENV
ncbi:hypothetical protein AAMO2058_000117900 [Amorphochlora amoebiformis]